jgi:hypothetical protein
MVGGKGLGLSPNPWFLLLLHMTTRNKGTRGFLQPTSQRDYSPWLRVVTCDQVFNMQGASAQPKGLALGHMAAHDPMLAHAPSPFGLLCDFFNRSGFFIWFLGFFYDF